MFDPRGPSFFELTRQALSSTTRGYDLLAEKFEYTPFRTPDELLEPLAAAAGEGGPIEAALDVCCGTGAVMRHLRPHCTERVVGVDLSQGMLDEAAKQLEDAPGDADVELIQGDFFEVDFDRQFDVLA
ncbi:MAG: class I SAM-dependent methyltransferase, partial [Persicimonas sp.]